MDTIGRGLASAGQPAREAKRIDIVRRAIPTWSHGIKKPRLKRDRLDAGRNRKDRGEDMAETDGNRRLAGRHILITGAASGIGKATAELFARHGAKLALVDFNEDGVKDVASALDAVAVPFDLSRTDEVEAMTEKAAADLGALDGVVNGAALGMAKPIVEMDMELIMRATAINFLAPYLICKAALPHIRKAGSGTIVNIASGQGLLPNAPGNTIYAGTKGGLIAFSKNLAVEAAPNIRVNAVCPGLVNTPMSSHLFADYDDPSEAPFVQQYTLKRVAEPIELANAILFLTSDESSYLTGSAIAVDGGRCFH
jgi:NAD(P)-dependent dehydrogenase (short-subunit alcohol dehydrogenase family)